MRGSELTNVMTITVRNRFIASVGDHVTSLALQQLQSCPIFPAGLRTFGIALSTVQY